MFTVGGATLAAEIEGKAMNSKRGRREEEGSEEVPITCHGHKTLPSHAAKILRQLLTFCQSSDSEIALYCRFRQTASQGIAVSRISALRGQIYPVLGCLFLSSFDNVPACFPPHIFEPHLFSCSRRSISEINSSKRFESCPSAASTQSRIQRSRFSASILPSAVRWQRHRANFGTLLLAPFDPKSRTKVELC